MKKNIAFIILLIFPMLLYAQSKDIKVIDSLNNPIEGAVVNIWNDKNGHNTQISNKEGEVKFTNLKNDIYNINVSNFGFYTFEKDSVSLPFTVKLKSKAFEIDEVRVVGKTPPQMTLANGDLSVKITGSFLEDFPDLQSTLKLIPNLTINEESIIVLGRGEALILLDGKEINSTEQIYSLNPSNIKDISIDSNPSSKYDSRYSAVIKVTTNNNKSEKLGFNIYNNSIFGRKYSNNVGVNIQSNIKSFSSFASYSYKNTKLLNYSKVEEYSDITNIYSDTMSHNRNSHYFAIGTDYTINQKNSISLDYNFSSATNNPVQYNAIINTFDDDILDNTTVTNVNKLGYFKVQGHNANLFYTHKIDSLSEIVFNVSYVDRYTINQDYIEQTGDINDLIEIANNSNSQSIMSNLDLTKSLRRGYMLYSGLRFSNIKYNYNSVYHELGSDADETQNLSHEQTASMYLEAKKDFGKLNILASGRLEWNQNRHTQTNYDDVLFQSLNVFPSLKANYEFSNKFSLYGNYTTKIVRPRFQQLTPTITYLTSSSYTIGNPQLQPTIIHDIEISGKLFNKLNLGVRYTKNVSDIIYTGILDSENKIAYTSINIADSKYLKYWGLYSNKFDFYQLSIYAMLTTPFVEIPYQDEIIKMNKPDVYVNISNAFSIKDNIDIYTSFAYQSTTNRVNITLNPIYNLSAGINYQIRDDLTFSLTANDLLFKNYSTEYSKYANIQTTQYYNYDMQRIQFSVNYRFNKLKIRSTKNSYNVQDMNRM